MQWTNKTTSSKIYKSKFKKNPPTFLICLKRWFPFKSWITVCSGKYPENSMFKVYSISQLNQRWENSVIGSLLRTGALLKGLKRQHVRPLLSKSSTRSFLERKKKNTFRYCCFYSDVFVNFWLYLLHVKRIVNSYIHSFNHSFIHSFIQSFIHMWCIDWEQRFNYSPKS